MPRKREPMEDPDLICRVPSSASGKITASPSHQKNNISKDMPNYLVSKHKNQDENGSDGLQDHLRILSNFSGTEDPYALLRELQIVPFDTKNGSSSGIDIRDFGKSGTQNIDDMLKCFDGKQDFLMNNGKSSMQNRMLIEAEEDNKNWNSFNGIKHFGKHNTSTEYKDLEQWSTKDKSKYDTMNHSTLCLGLIFTIQYLPVLVIAILYKVKTTEFITPTSSHDSNEKKELLEDNPTNNG